MISLLCTGTGMSFTPPLTFLVCYRVITAPKLIEIENRTPKSHPICNVFTLYNQFWSTTAKHPHTNIIAIASAFHKAPYILPWRLWLAKWNKYHPNWWNWNLNYAHCNAMWIRLEANYVKSCCNWIQHKHTVLLDGWCSWCAFVCLYYASDYRN